MKTLDLAQGTEVSEFTKQLIYQSHHPFPTKVGLFSVD